MESEEDVEAEFVGYDDKTIKKMQEDNKKKAEAHDHDHDHDHHEHEDGVYTVIDSITDVTTGENIDFKLEEPKTTGDSKAVEYGQMNFNIDSIVALK